MIIGILHLLLNFLPRLSEVLHILFMLVKANTTKVISDVIIKKMQINIKLCGNYSWWDKCMIYYRVHIGASFLYYKNWIWWTGGSFHEFFF